MSSTNRGAERAAHDFYATPGPTVRSIMEHIDWQRVGSMLEPCRGDGAIADLMPPHVWIEWAEIREGRDYLLTPFSPVDLVLTNPPFHLSIDFLCKSLTEARTVVYLQRLNWLGSQDRKPFWNANPPSHIFVLSKRPRFIAGKSGDSCEYAWFCWDRGGLITTRSPINVI